MRVNPEVLRQGDLKKQSQYAGGRISVKSYMKGYCGKILPSGAEENKANQSQTYAPALTKGVGKREKSLAAPPDYKNEAENFDFEWHSE